MGYVFLVLFGLTLFVMYIAIRRMWAPTLTIGGVGAILCMVFVILFALTVEDTSTAQALLAGIAGGLGFAAIVVVTAMYFRANQPAPDIKLVSQPQEKRTDGPNDNQSQTPE